ncbi:MAG: tetratricopeptide repeat protein [Chloroflexi bacterium]|nr:tetratricopeptide repeat protein [Chloroflexota bacterium]
MARNRVIYEEAMAKAHSYAWDARWELAVKEYERASAEIPDDLVSRLSLGMAYMELGRHAEALPHYQQAAALAPNDPLPLEKIAAILERLGQKAEAALAYAKLAQLRQAAHEPAQALAAWRQVINLDPQNVDGHVKLAEGLARQGEVAQAADAYVAAAAAARELGQAELAIAHCESALRLDPYHARARALRESLSIGRSLTGRSMAQTRHEVARVEGQPSPIATATQKALSRLAELIFEEQRHSPEARGLAAFEATSPAAERAGAQPGSPEYWEETRAIIGRAIDHQGRGVLDKAIQDYRLLLNRGADYVEVHFNLGVLLYKTMSYDQAVEHLERAAETPDYALASYFTLGQCYRAQGQLESALESYVKLLRGLDTTGSGTETDSLLQLYSSLTSSKGQVKDRERALSFIDGMTTFLTGNGWEKRILKVREQIHNLAAGDVFISLADIVEVPGSDRVLEALQRSQGYLERNLPMASIEECYGILDIAPNYVPVHAHLAEIFVRQNKIEQAVAKYATIASTYQVRGDAPQAISTYRRILDLVPLDVTVRPKLISLLTSRGQIDQALEEYLALAETYYRLAQPDKALEKYQEALTLAHRGSGERNWPVLIRQRIVQLYMQRLDWGRASAMYQEIKQLAPLSVEEHRELVDLYYKAGQASRAESELDELLNGLRKEGRHAQAIELVREMAEDRPAEVGLRMRWAGLLLEQGQREDAIAQLDALGEALLQQGRSKEAIAVIRQIIALKPRHMASYQQLLGQLTAQQDTA